MSILIKPTDAAVRLTGRWFHEKESGNAVVTAPGAYAEIAFSGRFASLLFNTDFNACPFPHVYLKLDGGGMTEAVIDPIMHIDTGSDGNHVLTFIFKSAVENYSRWYTPLASKITFSGVEAESTGILPPDNRKMIEFIGDSITEGCSTELHEVEKRWYMNSVWQNDVTATYAWQTAELLGMRPYFTAYGGVGITRVGCSSVPPAYDSYPYAYFRAPIEAPNADYIVINHGANDKEADASVYVESYKRFLGLVRKRNPDSRIVLLSAFCGVYTAELSAVASEFNRETSDNVFFINSEGWIPKLPVHPLRDGHTEIALRLAREMRSKVMIQR